MKRVAIIGCGRIAFKHIDAIIDNKEKCELYAICDIKAERMQEIQSLYTEKGGTNNVLLFNDYKELLDDTQIDFVVISTESGEHANIVVAALNAGKHVLTEKPMALSTSDADRMIAAAEKNGKKLAVSFQNRFNTPILKLKEAIDAGRLGDIMNGQIQIRWNRNINYYEQALWRGTWEQDGGTLMNQCTHGIDLLQWLMGSNVVRVHGVTRRYQRPIKAEDFGAAILEFKNGAVGIIEGSANVYPKNLDETLSLFGKKGTVVIGGLAVNKILTWRLEDAESIGDTEDKVIDPDAVDPPSVYGFGHSAVYQDMIQAIDENREPAINGREGKKAMEIVLAIYQSMKLGRPVDLPIDFSTIEMSDDYKGNTYEIC